MKQSHILQYFVNNLDLESHLSTVMERYFITSLLAEKCLPAFENNFYVGHVENTKVLLCKFL